MPEALQAQLGGGQLVARALKNHGVTHIFTLCGGHITPIYMACHEEGIRVIDLRHEQAVAMAADGLARATRRPAVALVTAGPGVTNALTGVANAFKAESPVVVIGGKSPFFNFEMGALQELDQVELMRPITRWARTVLETRRIPEYVAMGFRYATALKPGPVFLEVPTDILYGFAESNPLELPERTEARPSGDPAFVAEAARILAASERPVLMAGSSVFWHGAGEALRTLAATLASPVYTNGMGRGCMPPDDRLFFNLSRKKALGGSDAIVLIGTPVDFRLGYGRPFAPGVKLIQVDLDSAQIGQNRPVDVGLVGDSRAVLQQLAEAIAADRAAADAGRSARAGWVAELREEERKEKAKQEVLERSDATPMPHHRLCRELADFMDDETILVGDGGDIVGCAAKVIPVRHPGHWMDPGPLGCLGVGPPFAIAAKLAFPSKKVLLLEGDGSFGLNGFEIDTAIRHEIPFVTVVANDGGWGQIRNPQTAIYGPAATLACDLAFTRYDRVVEALGGYGEHVERAADLRPALERAFAAGVPACIDVVIDKNAMAGSSYMRGL